MVRRGAGRGAAKTSTALIAAHPDVSFYLYMVDGGLEQQLPGRGEQWRV